MQSDNNMISPNQDHNTKITESGNPAHPHGEDGEEMLKRMNESHSPMTLWALEFLNFKSEDKALDIGCGGGALLRHLTQRIPNGYVYGVDYSETSVKLSTETNRKAIEANRLAVIKASVENLPFENDTFDKITTVESFYFWPDPAQNLKEVYRILKKGGHFLLALEVYQNGSLPEHVCNNIQKYKMFVPSIAEFKTYFLGAGFRDISVHTREGELWIAIDAQK